MTDVIRIRHIDHARTLAAQAVVHLNTAAADFDPRTTAPEIFTGARDVLDQLNASLVHLETLSARIGERAIHAGK